MLAPPFQIGVMQAFSVPNQLTWFLWLSCLDTYSRCCGAIRTLLFIAGGVRIMNLGFSNTHVAIMGSRHESMQIVRLAKLRRCSRVQQFELEHDFQGASKVAKAAVYRKALFRDPNQTRKRTLFTLEPRPDAICGVFQPLNRRKFTLNVLNCPIWVLSNRTILTLSCLHPEKIA